MNEPLLRIIASVVTACLFCASTLKLLGAIQQSGYAGKNFCAWLKRKDNMYFNRLAVLSLCLAVLSAVVALCFSFLGERLALVLSAVPFWGALLLFLIADGKYALKVPVKFTGRAKRLYAAYAFVILCFCYIFIAVLAFLSEVNGSFIYGLIAYVPFSITPMLLPALLLFANAVMGIFERARNKKFVRRAGQVLDEQEIIRIGVVGSYGKTSVKNILKTLLAEKYEVLATPESYNTPMGIAKTVCSAELQGKQIFIAEMGARKAGDIAELCALVKPDYAIFTGICEQHIQTFGSLENVWKEKSEILRYGVKKAVCGESLRAYAERDFAGMVNESIVFEGGICDLDSGAATTAFTLRLFGQEVPVTTKLLGNAAAENIRLAVRLCVELGMTADEIVRGIEKLEPIPHRLQLIENNGIYILDDGYNCNPKGAEDALSALSRFAGRKCVVTPGIVECGILEEKINGELGAKLAEKGFDKVILVGNTLVGAVQKGYIEANGKAEALALVPTLDAAQKLLSEYLQTGDAVLFLNDLPDVY